MLKYKNETIGIGVADLTEVNEKFEENADWLKSKNLYADTNELIYNGNDNLYVGGADFYLPKGEYIFSAENNYSKAITFWFRDTSPVDDNTNHEVAVGGKTSFIFNVTASGLPISIGGRASDRSVLSVPNVLKNIMVRKSSETDDTYEPYRGKSNLELAEEISHKELELTELKMLGWNVPKGCPIQNTVIGNQFTQRVGRVKANTLKWSYNTASAGHERFVGVLPSEWKTITDPDLATTAYLDGYTSVSANDIYMHRADPGFSSGDQYVYIYDSRYNTLTALNNALGDKYVYYELATPIIKQIDGNEIISKDTVVARVNNFVEPKTDEEILALPNGIYSINLGSASSTLLPSNWGTLVVLKSGYIYGSMLYIASNAKMYFRNINNGAWREASWTVLN